MRTSSILGQRATFIVVFILVTVFLVGGSLWVLNFVRGTTVALAEEEARTSTTFWNYAPDGSYILPESNVAIAAYIQQYPQPQNVKVLQGLNTSEIWGYMTAHVAGGLQVDCSYCHDINNFALPLDGEYEFGGGNTVYDRKLTARIHLALTADLNQNWVTRLSTIPDGTGVADPTTLINTKQQSGSQIMCATCHLGQPIPEPWPADLHALPDNYRLPITWETVELFTGQTQATHGLTMPQDVLRVTGKDETVSLDSVQYNQYTMYHMNESLGVGCTHCHNSRYFPSWEQPAKFYALHMLQMTQYVYEDGTVHFDDRTYQQAMNGKQFSCWVCHRNQVLPPGAVRNAGVLPAMLTSDYVPGE